MPPEDVREPPTSFFGALRMTGPGIILAGTIVGSGELLITTGLGAKTGFAFLWLILFSCIIKVFIQIELGRYAISSGKPTLGALNSLSGPRFGAHILVWWWLLMMLATIFQLGAMTGTVGQSLNLAFPDFSLWFQEKLLSNHWIGLAEKLKSSPEIPWAFVTCGTAILLLWSGSYKRIEIVTTAIVVAITLLTVSAACLLPFTIFPIRWGEVGRGLIGSDFKFSDTAAIAAAFAVFGITGVGATELFYYPYWCLEKGYARYVGVDDGSPDWERRAKGWIRVMYLDAWSSMVVFTISTVAFYFMGACVLHPQGLDPKGKDMIEILSRMFVDAFGNWTRVVFLVGAGAILFKTLYLSSAANARLITDFLSLAGVLRVEQASQRATWIHRFSLLFPIVAITLFLIFANPKAMTIVGGFAQAVTLPMIAACALYFRYKRVDRRLSPSKAWDAMLWMATLLITIVASYVVVNSARDLYESYSFVAPIRMKDKP